MLTRDEILALARDVESDRVERKRSMSRHLLFDKDRRDWVKPLYHNVCAFANDLPHHQAPGYLLIGIEDDGRIAGLTFSDADLRALAGLRDHGAILPLPSIAVYKVEIEPGAEVAVVEVQPHLQPPVRYKGQIFVRIGPRLAHASSEDERALLERRHQSTRAWDEWLCGGAELGDLRMDKIRTDYVPRRIRVPDPAVLASRSDIDILDTLRLWYRGIHRNGPTHGAMLLFARDARRFYRGMWLQFVRFEGDARSTKVSDHQEYEGDVFEQLRSLEKIEQHLRTVTRPDGAEVPEYPAEAIREAVINAIMHRDYDQESPTQFYWFSDRIEILNAGGLLSGVDPTVFARDKPPADWAGRRTAYRNEAVSEAMKTYGFVHKFGTGIPTIRDSLARNGSPHAFFLWNQITFCATLYSATQPRFDTEEEEIAWVLQREGNERVGPLMKSLEERARTFAERAEAHKTQIVAERQAREAEAAAAQAALAAAQARAHQALAGMRDSLYAIAAARGLAMPDAVRARIEACDDAALLSRWIARAAVAATADAILVE